MSIPPVFSGFDQAFFDFFGELARHNERQWFLANKARYQRQVVAPMLAFIRAMQGPLAEIAPRYRAIPRATGGSMFRIYRDARFSGDKRPYKEHAAFHFRHEQGQDAHAPGYYLQLEPGRVFFGGGIWAPPARQLTKIRETIADSPAAWLRVRNDPAILACGGIQGDGLKTAPRGFARDHPQVRDLRRTSFFVMREAEPAAARRPDFVGLVAGAFKDCEPLMMFVCHALELPF